MAPSLARRLASLGYESLLVTAIVLGGAFAFFGLVTTVSAAASGSAAIQTGPVLRALFQLFVLGLLAGYFIRCWTRGGQTLPMKAWKLRLVGSDGAPVRGGRATFRYFLALALLGPAPIAAALAWRHGHSIVAWLPLAPALIDLAWALIDPDRQFLHDRLAGTRIVAVRPAPAAGTPAE